MPTHNAVLISEGDRYGRLVIILEQERRNGIRSFLCLCDCGNEKEILLKDLRKKIPTKSCGCLQRENTSKAKKTHGQSHNGTPEYFIWKTMNQRCYNPNRPKYKNYGARGIIVCDRWINSFENFLIDMGRRPTKHSIDRINVNGNYELSNCKWSTRKEQCRNKTNNIIIEYCGEKKTMIEWAESFNVPYWKLSQQLRRNEYNLDIVVFKYYQQFLYLKEAV